MNNAAERLSCVECGSVDSPVRVGPGPGWLALAMWALAAAVWVVGLWLPWATYAAAVVFFLAFVYTLWYFYKREQACRHCGGRAFEHQTTFTDRSEPAEQADASGQTGPGTTT